MAMSRRQVLVGGIALCTPTWGFTDSLDWEGLAHEDTQYPVIPSELDKFSNMDSLNSEVIDGYAKFGTKPATSGEEKLAQQVLNGIPRNVTPMEIALYFLNVGMGKYGEELKPYVTAWPIRWNPVIVDFFTETNTKPSGDTTAWCAAFVNFCLARAAKDKPLPKSSQGPTKSAASRSFREWSALTNTPTPGDIVVFKNVESPGHGHVGFFVADKGSSILVLGGNQFEGYPRRHTVNRKLIAKDGRILKFHSFRTDPQLHV